MVIYDQWSNMTMFGTLEGVCTAIGEGLQIDRLLFAESPVEQAILQENCSLTDYLQMVVQGPVFVLDIMARATKRIGPNAYGR
jgi:hypothetical protein